MFSRDTKIKWHTCPTKNKSLFSTRGSTRCPLETFAFLSFWLQHHINCSHFVYLRVSVCCSANTSQGHRGTQMTLLQSVTSTRTACWNCHQIKSINIKSIRSQMMHLQAFKHQEFIHYHIQCSWFFFPKIGITFFNPIVNIIQLFSFIWT